MHTERGRALMAVKGNASPRQGERTKTGLSAGSVGDRRLTEGSGPPSHYASPRQRPSGAQLAAPQRQESRSNARGGRERRVGESRFEGRAATRCCFEPLRERVIPFIQSA